jgi:hypothetical protein
MSSGGINHGRGLLLGQDSQGGLALVDRWTPSDEAGIMNHNVTILAASGGGKTYTASRLMLREWAQGAQVIAIDPLSDYRTLCEAVGGTWIDAGAGGTTRLNPLQAPPVPVGADGDEAGQVRPVWAHLQQVHLICDLYLPDLTAGQRALLGRALRAVYAARDIQPETDPATIPPEGWPHVGDVYALCRAEAQKAGAEAEWATLAALLEEAAIGTEADLWAGPSTLPPEALDHGFVVFDVHRLDRAPLAVQQAQYLNILSYAWSLAQRRPDQRTDLVVDEAWMLVNPKVPQALSFLKRMAKSIRHYQGSLVTITQNPGDFLFPEVAREGEPVLGNASVKLLLRQEARDLPTVTQLYQLSDAEQDLLRSAGRGQGLLIAGNHRAWVQVQGAPYEAALLGQG